MPTYPRYLTYQHDELETRLRELDPTGQVTVATLTAAANSSSGNGSSSGGTGSAGITGRGRLLKSHSCPVSFPDGQEGTCAYTRGGPAWHLFRFTHGTGNAGTLLPVLHMTERVGNDRASIEEAAKQLASAAYTAAIRRERTDYFQRVSEGGGRKRRSERCQMKTERAKQLAGRYALCRAMGGERLLPVSATFESLDAVNEAWREKGDRNLVVACCNRLDRCWEMPRYNPLYAAFDPRHGTPTRAAAPASVTQSADTEQDTRQSQASVTEPDEDWAFLPGPDCPDGDDSEDEASDLDEDDEEDEP